MTKTEALARIDIIRASLAQTDVNNGQLVSIIRDLWDGGDTEDLKTSAREMLLSDYAAERQIKSIIQAL